MSWVAAAVVASSYISGSMAQKGAETQAGAMSQSAAYQKHMFDIQTLGRQDPRQGPGQRA